MFWRWVNEKAIHWLQLNALFPHCLFILASWLLQKPALCAPRYFALKLIKWSNSYSENFDIYTSVVFWCLNQVITNITCYILLHSWFILIQNCKWFFCKLRIICHTCVRKPGEWSVGQTLSIQNLWHIKLKNANTLNHSSK